jgi:hypothetical protein
MAVSTAPLNDGGIEAVRRAFADRYAIERELGRGGMGAVYLARDVRLDRLVALKVLPAEFATQVSLRERFLQETRTAASFSHPNIVPIYTVEEAGEMLAYTMGFVEGETLTDRVRRAGPLPARELVRLLTDVGYALAYSHGRGVVHRDIKPDNVMIERATGRLLVMDFGISRSMSPSNSVVGLTRVGEVVGTPEYMSPEQSSGDRVDGRSDLYSLGLTAHFAATGRVAMTAESVQKILVRQLTEAVPAIASLRPDLPPALAGAVDRCVAKDPDERFATAEALEEALDVAQLGERVIPLPIRLFAGQASTLTLIAFGSIFFGAFYYRLALVTGASLVAMLVPAVMLVAVLFTRALATLAEARRLAIAGFTPDEIMDGLVRVADEGQERRLELRADPETRRRRRSTLMWAGFMLPMSLVMIWSAIAMRIPGTGSAVVLPPRGLFIGMPGIALLGASLVLLFNSPFRMSPGERFFRWFWLGAPGRWFVRTGAKRARGVTSTTLTRHGSSASNPAVARPAASASAAAIVAPARPAPAFEPAPAPRPPATPPDRLGALEARVSELERWRREGR